MFVREDMVVTRTMVSVPLLKNDVRTITNVKLTKSVYNLVNVSVHHRFTLTLSTETSVKVSLKNKS